MSDPVDDIDEKLYALPEFWIVSAPGDQTGEETYKKLYNVVRKAGVGYVFKFPIPELKVGNLDLLVSLSEELAKLDSYAESVTRKLTQYLSDVLHNEKDKVKENISVGGMSPVAYITKFSWDSGKYNARLPLKQICDMIAKNVSSSENDLKSRSQAFNQIKSNIQNIERKATGSLMIRSLVDVVKKEHFVLDSEYLTTLLVVVPTLLKKNWLLNYETLTDMVVPGSSSLITEDSEFCLFNVTLFKRVVDDYKLKCKENKFSIRDFEYNEEELLSGKMEIDKLNDDKKKQEGPLIRWLKINLSETFMAWVHIKALRTFIESILRYGLPVNFQGMVVAPFKRSTKRMKELLNQHYQHLDISGTSNSKSEIEDIPGFNFGATEYYPYVYFRINLDAINIPT